MHFFSTPLRALCVTAALAFTAQAQAVTVDFQITSTWNNGYNAAVAITNDGPAVNGWTLSFNLGHAIEKASRATLSGSDPYTLKSLDYSANIATNSTETVKYTGAANWSASGLKNCVFNGKACTLLVNGKAIGGSTSSIASSSKPPVASSSSSKPPVASSSSAKSSSSASGPKPLVSYEFNTSTELNNFLAAYINDTLQPQFTFMQNFSGASGATKIHLRRNDSNLSLPAISETPTIAEFGNNLTEATLVYRFKFGPNFDFERQGKLPGLGSFKPHFGGNKDDPVYKDSWSYRQMWLDTTSLNPRPDMYLYHQGRQTGSTGEHNKAPAGNAFRHDTWYTSHLYIKLNTKNSSGQAQSNGVAELWFDNKPMVCKSGIKFRGDNYTDVSNIGRLAFHFYHGGSATTLEQPSSESGQDMYFDYIKVYAGRVAPASTCQ